MRDRRIDGLLHVHQLLMPVLVRVPVQEWNVFGRDLDIPGPRLGQPARQQASQPETPDRLLLVGTIPRLPRPGHLREVGNPAGVFGHRFLRFQPQIKRLGRGRTQQAMRVVHRAQERLPLVIAAVQHHRTLRQQLPVKAVPILEPPRGHAAGRTNAVGGLLRQRDVEWAKLAPQKTGRRERLQLLPFPHVKALSNVDERRHRGIEWPQRAGHHRSQMRRGHGLRRRVTGVPMKLMPRM